MTEQGPLPTPPATLLAQLIALVMLTNPGYTADLPGSLVEDISSTDIGALTTIDQMRVELINSLTPFGANAFLLNQLGQIYGVPQGVASNTSVYCVFTGPRGFVISVGFVVSDGTYQYIAQDGGIIQSNGQSAALYFVATQAGTWAVPAGTVTQLVTSVPSTITLTVTNPLAGVEGQPQQNIDSYRTQVLQAGLAACQGMPSFVTTLLLNVPGVQSRLVSVQPAVMGGGWEVICGGGDPYAIAYAIFQGIGDIRSLRGSLLQVSGITIANPGVVTTIFNHNLVTGSQIVIAGIIGTTQLNNMPLTVTVLTEKTFSIVNTLGMSPYIAGGIVTPNPKNVLVSVNSYPNTYLIPFVNPPQQSVQVNVIWNTAAVNFVSASGVAQLGSPAIVSYINSIPVGQPINIFELQTAFANAIVSVLPTALLTRIVISVGINGVATSPVSGMGIVNGDPESYFLTDSTQISIAQG